MSNKITYQFSALPVEWVLNPALSATEIRIIAVLIHFSDNDNISTLGYEKLSLYAAISRAQCIRLIEKLEENGYLQRIIRNNRRFSTAIRVCLDNLGGDCQGAVRGITHDTPNQNRSITHDTPNKNQEYHLNNSGVSFKSNRSITGDTLNKNDLKDFKNTRAGARDETETADGAAVRSMPNAGQAGGTVQQGNEARFDLSDLNDCQCCLESIQGASDFSFLKSGKYLLFRPKGKFANVTDEIKNNITSFFSDKCGKMIFFIDAGVHYENEQKIV